MNAEIEQILINLEEYFDDRADADYQDGQYIMNKEMQRLSDVIRLKELLNKESKKEESEESFLEYYISKLEKRLQELNVTHLDES